MAENTEKKFKEKYLAGELAFEEIDDYSQEWGFSDTTDTLREYLGLNAEEEDAWVSVGDEALMDLLDQQKQGCEGNHRLYKMKKRNADLAEGWSAFLFFDDFCIKICFDYGACVWWQDVTISRRISHAFADKKWRAQQKAGYNRWN